MAELTQPTSSASFERAVPTYEVATEWGLFSATCVHPDRVVFSTDRTSSGGESSLLINRIRYSCRVTSTRGAIPEKRRSSYRRVDDTWQSDSAWYRFRRFGEHGEPTSSAYDVLHDQVHPALVGWLRGDDARDHMQRGTAYWRADCQRRADAAERMLSHAFQRIQDLRRSVTAGRTLTDDEADFLRHPSLDPDPP